MFDRTCSISILSPFSSLSKNPTEIDGILTFCFLYIYFFTCNCAFHFREISLQCLVREALIQHIFHNIFLYIPALSFMHSEQRRPGENLGANHEHQKYSHCGVRPCQNRSFQFSPDQRINLPHPGNADSSPHQAEREVDVLSDMKRHCGIIPEGHSQKVTSRRCSPR